MIETADWPGVGDEVLTPAGNYGTVVDEKLDLRATKVALHDDGAESWWDTEALELLEDK